MNPYELRLGCGYGVSSMSSGPSRPTSCWAAAECDSSRGATGRFPSQNMLARSGGKGKQAQEANAEMQRKHKK